MSEVTQNVQLLTKSAEIRIEISKLASAIFLSGRTNFESPGAWEITLLALLLELEPTITVDRIVEALPFSKEPLKMEGVLNTIANLGFYGRKHVDSIQRIDSRLFPALMVNRHEEPILPIRKDENGVLVFDPETQELDERSNDVNGVVWIFRRYEENRQSTSHFQRKGSGKSWFIATANRFNGTLFQVSVVGFLLNLVAISIPIYIMLVYDRVIASAAPDVLPMLCVGAIAAMCFDGAFRAVRASGLSWVSGRLDNIVGNRIFSHLLSLPPSIIENASVSSQISRIKTFEAARDFFSSPAFMSALDAPFVVLSIVVLYFVAGPLFLVPVAAIGLYCVLFWLVRNKIKTIIRIAAKASSARQQFAIETYEKIDTIRSQGLQEKWIRKFRDVSGREMMLHFDMGFLGSVVETLAHAITLISSVATIGFGVHLIWEGQISPGALVASMVLTWRALVPFYSLCSMVPRLEQIRNSILQINDLMEVRSEIEENPSAAKLPRVRGRITFDNVSFKYGEAGDYVFKDLSFRVAAGDFVALTGTTGGGKASILKLLQKLYQAESGAVRIDGFDIRQLEANSLRRQIAYVPKTPTLYSGSILENLKLVRPDATDEQIQRVLALSDAQDTINRLPKGLETQIGTKGQVEVNSSLAFKISLARGYLQEASILLIDEVPNSLLSDRLGMNLKKYLSDVRGQQTVFLSTYRTDFINMATTVINLKGREKPFVQSSDTTQSTNIQKPAGEAA